MRKLFLVLFVLSIRAFAQDGFTNKNEAENKLNGKLKEGKWIEYKDSLGRPTSKDSASFYHLVVYHNNVATGTGRDYYLSGNIQNEHTYLNGLKNGESKWYYEDGKLFADATYKDDKRIGVSKWYFKSGNLKEEAIYVDGKEKEFADGIMKMGN